MKPKGFGYAEFASRDGLKQALTLNGTPFQGRNIRISVADPRTCSHKFVGLQKLTIIQLRTEETAQTYEKSPTGAERGLCQTCQAGEEMNVVDLSVVDSDPTLVEREESARSVSQRAMERFVISGTGIARARCLHCRKLSEHQEKEVAQERMTDQEPRDSGIAERRQLLNGAKAEDKDRKMGRDHQDGSSRNDPLSRELQLLPNRTTSGAQR